MNTNNEEKAVIESVGAGIDSKEIFSNGLSAAHLERLALLSEELGEVQQIIGKIIRHGYESYNPFDEKKETNRSLLQKEIADVIIALALMNENADIDEDVIEGFIDNRTEQKGKYLHYNTLPEMTDI